jgi:hypothetical protein
VTDEIAKGRWALYVLGIVPAAFVAWAVMFALGWLWFVEPLVGIRLGLGDALGVFLLIRMVTTRAPTFKDDEKEPRTAETLQRMVKRGIIWPLVCAGLLGIIAAF